MRVVLVFAAAGILTFAARPASAAGPPAFDDRPILAQPFDRPDAPFRAVRVPEWVQDTTGCGYTLSGMTDAARAEAARHGVTLSEVGFVDPFYAYYDSKLLKRRSPHVPPDRVEKDIAAYKRLGVRVLGVVPPSLQGEVYENHPEWRHVGTNTAEVPQVDLVKYPHGGMLCLLGPYGDFLIDLLAEIVTRFPDVDAFSFDGLHYAGVCYCRPCREAFRRDTGKAIPDANLDDPAFRRYQHWADRRMEELVRRMQARLKGIKPTLALVTWTTNAGRFGHFLSVPRNMPARLNLLFDAPDQELWLDESNRGASIVPAFSVAYAWAVTGHRVAFSEPYLMSHGNPYGKDSFPGHEVLRRMLLTLTYGAQPSIAVGQPTRLQPAVYDALDEVRRRRPWTTRKRPEPWAALVMSDNTKTLYGRSAGQVEERYLAHAFGAFRALVEEHLPVTLIDDWGLTPESLAAYKVLILPNTACLDDAQAAAVEGFVRGGGGLVASLDTSLFDAFGDPRRNFALAGVLGVDHAGLPDAAPATDREAIDVNFAKALGPDYWEKRRNVFDLRADVGPAAPLGEGPAGARLRGLLGDEPVTFKGPAVRVRPRDPGARVLATLQTRRENAPPPIPAVVEHAYGRGRVVYLAAGLDAAHYLYAYPYQRLLLRRAVERVAPEPPPLAVEAPLCVHATLTRQDARAAGAGADPGHPARLVAHLFSDLNTTAFHARQADDVPLREEAVPLHDLRLTFAPRYRFRRLRLEPDGLDLPPRRAPDGGTTVVVPRLDVHAMVVGELE